MTIEQELRHYKRQLVQKEIAGILTHKEVTELLTQKDRDLRWTMIGK